MECILSIPWNVYSDLNYDLSRAEKVFAKEHYGVGYVKACIIEHMAVQIRSTHVRGPILCIVGPPGVGKTSLAKSIADATGRVFVKISLGGVRDEAEIRGHRRTIYRITSRQNPSRYG